MTKDSKSQALTKHEIVQDFQRIQEIFSSEIFAKKNQGHPLLESAFTELIIRVRDLVAKCKIQGCPVGDLHGGAGSAQIEQAVEKIIAIRNAACHVDSPQHAVNETTTFTFNSCHGDPNRIIPGITAPQSPIQGDVAFIYGKHVLWLAAEICAVIELARVKLTPAPET